MMANDSKQNEGAPEAVSRGSRSQAGDAASGADSSNEAEAEHRESDGDEDESESGEDDGDEEDDDDDDDDDEPKLKYARLTGHVTQVYRNGDATSCFLVAGDKMVCLIA